MRNFRFITPDLTEFLTDLYYRCQKLTEGTVTSYLPQLAEANPDWFGISVVGVDGKTFNIGQTAHPFTIQSISKPFVYGLALEDRGLDYVRNRIGVEPTGDSFNSIIDPVEIYKKQYNPMVNSGAIVATSLIQGNTTEEKYNRLIEMFRRYIGRSITIDTDLFRSKQATDHLNRAIAYLMLNFELLEGNVDEVLNLYFQQCSLMVNCHDLAIMGATLANGGINPITGEQAITSDYVKNLLSVMYTCGLYDFSGQWAYKVGIPAKSGVSGGIMAVIPQKMGIAVFSPPLNQYNKSLRGVRVLEN
jgi:glutaminase